MARLHDASATDRRGDDREAVLSDAPSSWPPDQGYYQEGWWLARNTGYRGKVGSSHRMISTYLNSLTGHGLVLDRAAEPPPGADMEQRRPPGAAPVPFFFAARFLKR